MIRGKPQGLLETLPTPAGRWELLTMNFITGLSDSQAYEGTFDSIFVVVDRFIKIAYYIFCRKIITAENLAKIFMREMVRLHGNLLNIIFNRGVLFIFCFWANFMFVLKIKRQLSTVFYFQTDGQTER